MRGIMSSIEEVSYPAVDAVITVTTRDGDQGVATKLMSDDTVIIDSDCKRVDDPSSINIGRGVEMEVIPIAGTDAFELTPKQNEKAVFPQELVAEAYFKRQSPPILKRGQQVIFMDIQEGMQIIEGQILLTTKLPIPNDYVLSLVRTKNKLYVIVHASDWMRMADGVRQVENDDVDAVSAYLAQKQINYIAITAAAYGGKNGLSMVYAASRLWKPVTGRPVKVKDLIL